MTNSGRRVIVFLGPTLSAEGARAELDADVRPPAACGDVLRAAEEDPWAIGLVDGYFERVPAVWHKEILWALDRGIHVFGAASMGALRAAELAEFGMVGVGKIFEAYRSGELERDDEVALVHAPAEHGYYAGSEAMANLRATFGAARDEQTISASTHDSLVAIARDLYYPRRDYDSVLEAGRARGLPERELDAFESWLPEHRVDQKKEDAVAMLREIARRRAADPAPMQTRFAFQRTNAWEELSQKVRVDGNGVSVATSDTEIPATDWLEALRKRSPESFARLEDRAWTRVLVRRVAGDQGVDERLVADRIADFCRRHGLDTGEALECELRARGVDFATFLRAMQDEARCERLRRLHAASWPARLEEQARLDGLWREPRDTGQPEDEDQTNGDSPSQS